MLEGTAASPGEEERVLRRFTHISIMLAILLLLSLSAIHGAWPPAIALARFDERISLRFCPGRFGSLSPIAGFVNVSVGAAPLNSSFVSMRLAADVFVSTDGRVWEAL